jgi:16S rRNA (cytosine1402-N4)-methyltransferase
VEDPAGASTEFQHVPVLLAESLQLLDLSPGVVCLDATLGGAGHSAAIVERISPGGTLIGMDQDEEAIGAARKRLASLASISIVLVHSPFAALDAALNAQPGGTTIRFDAALFDLGVSSHQLDTDRGFSFRRNEPLDMKMDASDRSRPSAAELLGDASETEIARILWEYGEEQWSRRIAKRIIERREKGERLSTTGQLAELIEQCIPRAAWPKNIHVATRSFQALRIAVNDELGQLRSGLQAAFNRLKPGGRLAVISYHSLEDRIVKQMFAQWAGKTPSEYGSSPAALLPQSQCVPIASLLTRKPVSPTVAEIARNPRARSAKLRALQRIR